MIQSPSFKKVYLIGLPGCGKTTLAKKISKQFGLPHIEFDYLFKEFGDFNGRKYRPLSENEYLPKVDKATKKNAWVVEGGKFVESLLEKADVTFFIDIPVWKSIYRLCKRYFTNIEQQKIYGLKENLRLIKKVLLTGEKTRKKFKGLCELNARMKILKNSDQIVIADNRGKDRLV